MIAHWKNVLMQSNEEVFQMVDQIRTELRCVFCWLAVLAVVVMLAVASCTSNQEFNYLYVQITELFSLSKTSWSSWLLSRSWFGHFVGYALLTVVLSGVFSFYFENHYKLFAAPVIAGLFGLLMEFAQVFIPSRGASLIDMGVNIVGIAVGLGVYLLVGALVRDFHSGPDPEFDSSFWVFAR